VRRLLAPSFQNRVVWLGWLAALCLRRLFVRLAGTKRMAHAVGRCYFGFDLRWTRHEGGDKTGNGSLCILQRHSLVDIGLKLTALRYAMLVDRCWPASHHGRACLGMLGHAIQEAVNVGYRTLFVQRMFVSQ
jgi:hypothetical protein